MRHDKSTLKGRTKYLATAFLWGCVATVSAAPTETSKLLSAADELYYRGYDVLKLKTAPFGKTKFQEEEKQAWKLVEQAARQGSVKALRGMGVHESSLGHLKEAQTYYERAIDRGDIQAMYFLAMMKEGADSSASPELQSALGKFKNSEAADLLLKAAEHGSPDAQDTWCLKHPPAPGSVDARRCDEWGNEGAAKGYGRAWGGRGRHFEDLGKSYLSQAFDEGLGMADGSFSLTMREPSAKGLADDHPLERCRDYLTHYLLSRERFLFVFNEQLCVPPMPHWPAWRGLGKDFKAPPSSEQAEQWYQQGLQKLADQDIKGGGELLKKAVEAGHTGAMLNLGLIYREYQNIFFSLKEGIGVDKLVYQLFLKADELGDVRGHYLLAYCHDFGVYKSLGDRVKNDPNHNLLISSNRLKAEQFETESAERGLPRAQYILGWRLIREEREQEGWPWLKKAFDNGERIAGFDLYRIARYVWKDDAQALRYLQASAEQGELASVDILGDVFEQGLLGQGKNAKRAACYRDVVTRYKGQPWEQRLDLRLPQLHATCQ